MTAVVPFTPKGAEAEWCPLYRAAKKLAPGDTLSYGEMEELLGRPLGTERGPVYRAIRELEKVDKRTMECVPREGYRVLEAHEHERVARHHQKKSTRQLGKSLRKVRAADRRKLTAALVAHFDDLELRYSRMESMVRRLDDRQRMTETRTEKVERDQGDLAAQVQKLQAALERRGLLDNEPDVRAA